MQWKNRARVTILSLPLLLVPLFAPTAARADTQEHWIQNTTEAITDFNVGVPIYWKTVSGLYVQTYPGGPMPADVYVNIQAPLYTLSEVAPPAATTVPPTPPAIAQTSGFGIWDCIARYESGGNWSIDTGNHYYGGLQILQSTWAGYGGLSYAPRADLATPAQQVAVAEKILAAAGWGQWPSTSRRCGV